MADVTPLTRRYQFGVFSVDMRSGELCKRGIRVKLQKLPFHLLVTLLERPGEIVSREELCKRLWPEGTFVDFDNGLNSAINKLRNALHDSATHPRYIETMGREGYRFLYPIAEAPADPSRRNIAPATFAASRIRRTLIISAVGVAVLALAAAIALRLRSHAPSEARIHSIAVLPLKNLSNDPAEEYFSEGLTDELITRLASLPGLRVISHTSVMQYEDTRKPLPAIAKELNVDAVVEGTVLRSGGRVRITAQLIAAPADRHIWARSYERDQGNILALQNEVARDIAENVTLSLNPAERQRLASAPSCADAEAYDLYLHGQYYWNKRTVEDLRKANDYFQQAAAKDPNCALVYAGLADAYMLIGSYSGIYQASSAQKARSAALHALEIDETLPEAHTALALIVESYDWDWPRAEKEFQRAIQLNPNYATAHHWYAEHLMWRGRFDEALRESELARQLDPLSLIIAADNGAILYYARQYDQAIAKFRWVLEREPRFPRAEMICGAYAQKRMFAEAVAEIQNARRAGDSPWSWAILAYIYGRSGRKAKAAQALKSLLELNRKQRVDATALASAYIGVGKRDQALTALERAASDQPNALTSLKVDPMYDPLRSDPRFQDLLRRVGLAQ